MVQVPLFAEERVGGHIKGLRGDSDVGLAGDYLLRRQQDDWQF